MPPEPPLTAGSLGAELSGAPAVSDLAAPLASSPVSDLAAPLASPGVSEVAAPPTAPTVVRPFDTELAPGPSSVLVDTGLDHAPARPRNEPEPATIEPAPSRSAPPGPTPDAPDRATRAAPAIPRWIWRPAVIYLASRALSWSTLAVTSLFTHAGIGGEIYRWDSKWFIRAAANGWPSQLPHRHGHVAANTIAFFPVFPLSFRWLSHLTGLSLLTSGTIVTSLSGLTAMVGVWMLIGAYLDESSADRGTLLVAMFPGSFVLSMVYSEGLVVTFVAFGLLALLRRRWLLAGLLGMLATATTPIALAFGVSGLWCAYREVRDNRNWRSLLAPVLTPIGFLAYQVWLWVHTGNVSAWRLTERGGWKSYPSLVYAAHTIGVFLKNPIATNKTDDLLFVGTVLTLIAAVVAIRSRQPTPVLLYGLVAAGVAFVSAPVGLRPRFMFLAFPLIIAVGTRLRGRAYLWVLSASMALLVFAMAYEVSSWAVFP